MNQNSGPDFTKLFLSKEPEEFSDALVQNECSSGHSELFFFFFFPWLENTFILLMTLGGKAETKSELKEIVSFIRHTGDTGCY